MRTKGKDPKPDPLDVLFDVLVENDGSVPTVYAHHEEKVRKVLGRLRGSKLTYVDASSLAFLDQAKIRRVWSTDHHLGLTGAEVFPVA